MREGLRTLVVAEDDDDDFLLTVSAMEEAGLDARIERVRDGEELIDLLLGRGHFASRGRPLEGTLLVLLDLNMPRKDGREALKEIKTSELLRRVPVVVLTTSQSDDDVAKAYELGVNSFVRKPANFDDFVEYAKALKRYWFEVAELPSPGGVHGRK